MLKYLSTILLVCCLASAGQFKAEHCNRDPKQFCANIKNAFEGLNSGSKQVSSGLHVNDGPALASIINGNYTQLRFTAERLERVNRLDDETKDCITDIVNQAQITTDYIDTISNYRDIIRDMNIKFYKKMKYLL